MLFKEESLKGYKKGLLVPRPDDIIRQSMYVSKPEACLYLVEILNFS